MNITCTRPLPDQSKKIATIHLSAFPNFFLSSMGFNFLNVFYKIILEDINCISTVVMVDNEIVGFAIGVRVQAGFYLKIFKAHFLKLASAAFLPLLLSPLKIVKLLKVIGASNDMPVKLKNASCLLSICVDPKYNSVGLGSILINNFERELKSQSSFFYFLTTDAQNNDNTNFFYLKNNFKLFSNYWQNKSREMNIYVKDIAI